MKLLRIWLLVLLAVLLPIRGAYAAAMQCPGMGAGMEAMDMHMAGHGEHHDAEMQHHGDDMDMSTDMDMDMDVDTSGGDAGPSPDNSKSCHFCAAFCSATPLPCAMPAVPEPAAADAASFPTLTAAAAHFQSDGQERPPRST